MYGIVNKAIEELIIKNYGEQIWFKVKERSGIDIEFFLSNDPYDDEITFKLAIAASEELDVHLDEILFAFGEFWVLETVQQKYGSLMEAGGNSLKSFLFNLPMFHNRIMFIYPKLTPPEFKVSEVEERSILVHYHSKREGLQEFVRGLLSGLAKAYKTKAEIKLLQGRKDGSTHEIFKVSW
jgi:hypothetical protein